MNLSELAAELADLPRWLDARGMLLRGRCQVFGREKPGAGYLAREPDVRLIAVVGRPSPRAVRQAVVGTDAGWTLVSQRDQRDLLAAQLPGWQAEDAVLHTLEAEPAQGVGVPDAELRLLTAEDRQLLAELPATLASEIEWAIGEVPIVAAFVEGRVASICCACRESETLWDISIDTLEPYRRRGLAAACVSSLVWRMRQRGKEPVWGAVESNSASLNLAAKLGFRPVDPRIAVFTPVDPVE